MNARPLCMITALVISAISAIHADERSASAEAPKPRPRLTQTLRERAEEVPRVRQTVPTVTMDKVVVREERLPKGPAKEPQTIGEFSATHGGYVLKKEGDKFTTEAGLWRHISVVPLEDERRDGNVRIRMGVLRISW
jgi:hypothetical protein